MIHPVEAFKEAIAAHGLKPPSVIIDDGKIHRFNTDDDRRHSDTSGWYVFYSDGTPAGVFGCWRHNVRSTWCAKPDHELSKMERESLRNKMQAIHAQQNAKREEIHAEARAKAAALLARCSPATTHPYLSEKGIAPHGVKTDGDDLLIPLSDIEGTVHTVQRISPDGTKRFMFGGKAGGGFFLIGAPREVLVIAEGFATAAAIHEACGHAVAAAFSASNLEAVAIALRAKYPDLQLIVAADDDHRTPDNPGLTHARAAAIAVHALLAIPAFPTDRPDKATDFDDLRRLCGDEAVRTCILQASQPQPVSEPDAWPQPEPLLAQYAPVPYPLDALPAVLRAAVEEVIGFVKAPVALAASSALSVVSVAVQGLYDVERAPGLMGPSSVYLLTIADSGERKSSCDGYFRQSLEKWQRDQEELHKPALAAYEAELATWEAKRTGILDAIRKASKDGEDTGELERALHELGQEKPEPVRLPRLVRGDDTPEAIGWSLSHDWPTAGVLSSEAGIVFGSHAMNSDSIMRNLALVNTLWDGGRLAICRRTSESYTVEGVRLTMGLQVQEATLRAFFDKSKGLARGTGFLARFLLAWPASTMGTRRYSEAPDWSQLQAFHQRIEQLLSCKLSMDKEGRLTPTKLPLSREAHAAWVTFQNDIEEKLGPDGELHDVKDVAAKVADNAARLAGLFHVFEHGIGEISVEAMVRAAKLAAWHLSEARRFLGQFALPVEWMNACRLDEWVRQRAQRTGESCIPTRAAQQYGPLRDKSTLHAALADLAEAGRVRLLMDGKRRLILVNPALLGA